MDLIAHLRNSFNQYTHLHIAMIIPECWLRDKKDITCTSFLKIEWSLFVNTWFPFIQGSFVRRLVEIGPIVLEKKNLKTKLMTTRKWRTTVKFKSEKLTWAFCSGELKKVHVWVQNSPDLKLALIDNNKSSTFQDLVMMICLNLVRLTSKQ